MRQPTLLDFMEYMQQQIENDELQKANDELQSLNTDDDYDADEAKGIFDFSEILGILKSTTDDIKVRRITWGASVSVYLVTQPDAVTLNDGKDYYPQPYFTLISGDQLLPWVPDTEDLLADNWIIVDET